MWIPVLVMVAVVALALGPILMIAPSKRQQRIAKLRTYASTRGLLVRLVTPPPRADCMGNEGRSVAKYLLRWPATAKPPKAVNWDSSSAGESAGKHTQNPDSWCLVKEKLVHEIHFDGAWEWGKSGAAPKALQQQLRDKLVNLPEDVIAIEADREGISCYWWEHGDIAQLDQLIALLQQLRAVAEASEASA